MYPFPKFYRLISVDRERRRPFFLVLSLIYYYSVYHLLLFSLSLILCLVILSRPFTVPWRIRLFIFLHFVGGSDPGRHLVLFGRSRLLYIHCLGSSSVRVTSDDTMIGVSIGVGSTRDPGPIP